MDGVGLEDLSFGGQLGRGVTSKVLLAVLKTDRSQRFAVKTVEKAKIAGQAALARLYREKDLLASLEHPNIVHFYRTLKDEQHLYFVLEHLDGGELLWHMRRSPRGNRVPAESARTCLAALLLALTHLQQKGILYRDIKPTNIMFTRSGRLKLVDFGHAKRMGAGERSTSVSGTPHFQAPEIVRGEPHGLPAQLWALGILIIEMIAGRPPFAERSSGPTLKEQILGEEVDLICLPDAARPLVAALLERDAAVREACFPAGFSNVMKDAWLSDVDWPAIEAGSCVPDFAFALHAEEQLETPGLLPGPPAAPAKVAADDPFADFG